MSAPTITVTPVHVADLMADEQLMPVYVHVIDHPQGRVLVDTGLTTTHPLVEDMEPRINPRGMLDLPDVDYVPVDGEPELMPGIRLAPGPGHTRGSQMVIVESGPRPIVIVGDLAVSSRDLDEPQTPGQLKVRELDPELVWLSHQHEPWRPSSAG